MNGANRSPQEDRDMAWLPIASAAVEMLGQHATDAAQQAMIGADETHQLMLQAQEMAHQEVMDQRSEQFNEAVQERSERMRERSLLDDLNMTDRKIDDKLTKDWLGLIRGQ
jgi:hypothetical protein